MKKWMKLGLLVSVVVVMSGCVAQVKPKEIFGCATYSRTEAPTRANTIQEAAKMSSEGQAKYQSVYEIFVGSFHDTNNDGIGDIQGIIDKLDYIKDLGFSAIWLTPVHPSSTYHKYDIIDYQAIDPQFGTLADYEKLIQEAHKRDIRIIQDLVINHVSVEHPWFKDLEEKGAESAYCSYFVLRQKEAKYKDLGDHWYPMKGGLTYYASFWEKMPELRLNHPEVQKEINKNIAFWQDKGVDGFRLDASGVYFNPDEYPIEYEVNRYDSVNLVKYLHSEALKRNKDTYFVTETWESADSVAPFYAAADSSFNFDLAKATLSSVRSTVAEDYKKAYLTSKKMNEEVYQNFTDATFLTNHDQNRVTSVLPSLLEQKMAASILLTTPGVPYVYYGEEIGMKGEKPDESIREPMKWGETQFTNPKIWKNNVMMNQTTPSQQTQAQDTNSLYTHYKRMLALRKQLGNIQQAKLVFIDTEANILTYTMDKKLIMHNLSDKTQAVTTDVLANADHVIFGEVEIRNNSVEMSGKSTVAISLK